MASVPVSGTWLRHTPMDSDPLYRPLAALGLPDALPGRDQWPSFQRVGEQLHASGVDGLMYRSAAHPEGVCLCVFRASRVEAIARLEPLPPPRRVDRPPAPPRGLRT